MRFVPVLLFGLVLTGHAIGAFAFDNGRPSATPAKVQSVAELGYVPGKVSRYQRKVIVPGGPDGEMNPCAESFDAVMDHLEGLMAKQIEENNRIAQQQAADPRFEF